MSNTNFFDKTQFKIKKYFFLFYHVGPGSTYLTLNQTGSSRNSKVIHNYSFKCTIESDALSTPWEEELKATLSCF